MQQFEHYILFIFNLITTWMNEKKKKKEKRLFTIPILNLKSPISRLISSRIFTKVCQAICQSQKYRSIGLLDRNFNSALPFCQPTNYTFSQPNYSLRFTHRYTHYCSIISISRVQTF